MEPVALKPDVYWVGAVDWTLREFHGYRTPRGTTYNAYLIVDKDVTLIDTVKKGFYPEMMERIRRIVDPKDIVNVVCNHVEMDHSGSLPELLSQLPHVRVLTSPKGESGLRRHFKQPWNLQTVASGETVSIGSRTLQFHHLPMVHWPDSMATYSASDAILFPNDAFGQHIASAHRFDDQVGWDILAEEAATYYANIVLPYSDQVAAAMPAISSLKFDMIAPSHGAIWRSFLPSILASYQRWSHHQTRPQATIIYDTMWGSTERMAAALRDGLEHEGVPVTMHTLRTSAISEVMTSVLSSQLVLIGSPTVNNGLLHSVGGLLTYLKGLRPRHRIGFAFGSYGWGGQAAGEIEATMKALSWELPVPAVKIPYVPDDSELQKLRDLAVSLAKHLKKDPQGDRVADPRRLTT